MLVCDGGILQQIIENSERIGNYLQRRNALAAKTRFSHTSMKNARRWKNCKTVRVFALYLQGAPKGSLTANSGCERGTPRPRTSNVSDSLGTSSTPAFELGAYYSDAADSDNMTDTGIHAPSWSSGIASSLFKKLNCQFQLQNKQILVPIKIAKFNFKILTSNSWLSVQMYSIRSILSVWWVTSFYKLSSV